MKFINEQNEKLLLELNFDKTNMGRACRILENAVIQQFQSINLGLLSGKVLNGELTDDDFQNYRKMLIALFPNDLDMIDDDLFKYISNGIYEKKWDVIDISDLKQVEIFIVGKSVRLWDVFEINEQLSILLSDYRVYFAGAMNVINVHLKEMFGKSPISNSIDARFIVGTVGVTTISYGGRVFDFVEEVVSSPYLDNTTPGFSIGDTAIIRREVLKKICKVGENIAEYVLHTYLHEVLHTLSYSFKEGLPYASANWETIVKRDICRFLKKKYEKKKIEEAFLFLIENKMASFFGQDEFKKFTPFWSIFESLLEEGVVIENQGFYSCVLTKEGQSWDLI